MDQQLILDRYRPLDFLGEGAFGSVTLAWDTRMQRRVAIKRLALPVNDAGSPHQPPGLAEARTAAMLSHPGIVTVFDFDTDRDEAFLVMEYVDGASLAEVIDRLGGPLSADEAASVLRDVAAALEFAHVNGVLHLDIKPENVLIDRDGHAKVADFGVAELSSLSGHGPAFGGTPGYMPVEQLSGGEVTERTDEWALAAVAYEALTGTNPFADDMVSSSADRMEVFDPPLPTDYEPALGAAVDDVVLAALGPHPQDRYESVAEFAGNLLPLLGDARTGRASLAELIGEQFADDAEAEERYEQRIGMWDRLEGRGGRTLVRLIAAVEAGWLAWSGLAPFALEPAALFSAVGLISAAALFAPGLGIGLGLACFIAGFASQGAWLIAGAVLLGGGAWWWLVARHSPGAAVLPMSGPVLAVARIPFLGPLIAGFVLPPLAAASTALVCGVLVMLASALSAEGAPYLVAAPANVFSVWRAELATQSVIALVRSPAALVALAGWPVAAAWMSLMCARANRAGAVLGALGGSAILGGSYVLARLAARALGHAALWDGRIMQVALGVSAAVMLAVIVLGAPVRGEE